jgi:signal transduction histidine kinase
MMEERVGTLGGALKIESTPQKGTTVRAEIQITKPAKPVFPGSRENKA